MSNWWTRQQLKSKHPATRRQAIEKLVASGTPAALDDVAEAASDPDREVRVTAIHALGGSSDNRGFQRLIAGLQDVEAEVREASVLAMQRLGEKQAIGPLTGALRDPHGAVRWRAAKALAALGWQPANEAERISQAVALGEFAAAAKFGRAAVEPLVNLLKDRTFPKRVGVVDALVHIEDDRVARALIAALKDPDPHVRVATAEAFTQLRDARAVEPLALCLRDNEPMVRAAAATTLGKLGDARGVEPLTEALSDRNWSVRRAAVEGLGLLGDARAVEALSGLLKDPDHDVREAAVAALGQIGDRGAIEGLVGSLADAQSIVRRAAAGALVKLDEHWERSPAAQRAIPGLQASAQERDYWVRHTANQVLETIRNAPQAAASEKSSPSTTTVFKRSGAVDALIRALQDYDRDIRQAAAEALGRIGDPSSISPLTVVLADEDPWVRHSAGKALEALGWRAPSHGGSPVESNGLIRSRPPATV